MMIASRLAHGFSGFRCTVLVAMLHLGWGSAVDAQNPGPGRTPHPALLDTAHAHWKQRAPDVFRARFETSRGTFVIEVHRDWAPIGADRFYNLARAGFFDDSRFFRTVENYIAMFGIPGDPRIARVWRYATIKDDPRKHPEVRGAIAYARFAPDNRTTQLYINRADRPQEVEPFAPFGTVIEGMSVVDSLYSGYGNRSGGSYRGGQQDSLFLQGNAYLDRAFPLLDRIIRVKIESAR